MDQHDTRSKIRENNAISYINSNESDNFSIPYFVLPLKLLCAYALIIVWFSDKI